MDPGSGLSSAGFAGIDAPRAVFPTIAFTQNGEVCTVHASADFFPENLDIISMNPSFATRTTPQHHHHTNNNKTIWQELLPGGLVRLVSPPRESDPRTRGP